MQELEAFKAQLEEQAKEKAAMVEQLNSKQTALDSALQQQGDSDKELAGVKERLEASIASKDETAQVSLCIMVSTFEYNNCSCKCLRIAFSHV